MQSKFHAVFSDHKLRIQKYRCKNPECNWQSTPTITSMFGSDIHPDLAKLQCEQGALHSYREAETNLEKLNAQRRRVNNHARVKTITNQLGAQLAKENQKSPNPEELPAPARKLVVQVDGGHIPAKDRDKRSFEALSGVIYREDCLEVIDKHHRRITEITCVISALDDDLKSIKTYLYNAALRQGLTEETHVIALADGAGNCWSAISSLETYCKKLECILDWFHIVMKIQTVKNALDESFEESLDSAKWSLWHGEAEDALRKIGFIRESIIDNKERSKLKKLQEYLENNRDYLVNYNKREEANKTFTSQVAESHIDTLINDRHKRKQIMQWTQEGAHNVLQIRALMASNKWEEGWLDIALAALEGSA